MNISLAAFNALLAQEVGTLRLSDLESIIDFLNRRCSDKSQILNVITLKFVA